VAGFLLKSFLRPEEVLPACQAIFHLHMQYGGRQKGKTRLKFLIGELGHDRFTHMFEEVFAAKKALPENRLFPLKLRPQRRYGSDSPPSLGERLWEWRNKKLPMGWEPQRQAGRAWCELEIPLGDIRWNQLAALAQVAQQHRGIEVAFNMDQNVELHWVRNGQIPQIQRTLAMAELTLKSSQQGPRVVSCPGTEFCVLAVTNSQGAARELRRQIIPSADNLRDLLSGLTVHISGCPNSCAKQQIADIGLTGGMAPLGDHRRYCYQLTVGGGLQPEPKFASVVRKGLTEEMVVPAIQTLLAIAAEQKLQHESFRECVHRLGPTEVSRLLEERLTPQKPRPFERIAMSAELQEAR
jgi:sulfite reductase beta subunit-like hemoprotein